MISHTLPQYRSLRVLQVCPRYFPHIDRVQDHTYQLSRRLAAAGISVTILTSNPDGRLPDEEQSGNVRIKRVRSHSLRPDSTFAPDIYPIIAHAGWDIVHIQSYQSLFAPLAMLAALRAKIPYVVTLHSGNHTMQLRGALRGIQRRALRPLLSRAARLIATNNVEPHFFGERLGLPAHAFSYIPGGSEFPGMNTPKDQVVVAATGHRERPRTLQRLRLGSWDECSANVLTLYENILGPRYEAAELAVGAV